MQSLTSWLSSKSLISPTEMEAAVAVRPLVSPAACTVPAVIEHNVISQLRTHVVQGQHELSGTQITNLKSAVPKRPHSPTSEEYPKRPKDRQKVGKHG